MWAHQTPSLIISASSHFFSQKFTSCALSLATKIHLMFYFFRFSNLECW
ncbi:hypothetical protein BDA96_05G088300 [Sorghum bicolor]|uniref:Uncharacterized protein n=2 Tax=Sorghum bicolor TaxID=4558 RepID=A0A921UES7_SORBI|nr:hypothetical protein BDA96_05G088300 [Sorghum bicolor]KAG0529318.1 hypothetical protein BDA96_05G088300 [Sorghum bicolor]KXG28103.1 hypothetical protein SORBI_3005G085500 [Sorghum bicolor]KXG28104.1 hypothetical protein SORBI_3005G085500 [Sorghum bicolor]KXG28105.1 hypothetical protein SORBI_3005G085500 [Sorghum bicolor]